MVNTVLHFVKKYLQLSETFIYDELMSLKNVNSILLTKNLINENIFPFKPILIMDRDTISNLRKEQLKLIHARFAWSGMTMLPIARKLGVPMITSFYGVDISRYPRHFTYRHKLKQLFKGSPMFLAQSNDMKKDMMKLGCESSKIEVFYNGINVEKFKFKDYSKDTNIVNILMCGRFVEKKGMEYGIRAFANLKNKNAVLSIIGDGENADKLKLLVKSLNIEQNVTFYGFCLHPKIIEILSTADIFLAPHIAAQNGDKEGMPNTIKEAMATGLPVVATNHAGIPELVADGENGFLVPEKDVQSLQEKLDWLIEHRETWKLFGEKGRAIVEEKFNFVKQSGKLEKLYQKFN
ncbi:MAG: glycosyltransferase [bacterium]|nr:glycosyltransferase [bacterium]